MKKVLLITAGNISLALGIAGILLPVLPTTPFLLLSAACYLKSSQKLYEWLISHKIFGSYIESYLKYKAVSFRAKVISIITLWLVIGASVIFFVDFTWARISMILVALAVTVYLVRMKTLTEEMIDDLKRKDIVTAEDS